MNTNIKPFFIYTDRNSLYIKNINESSERLASNIYAYSANIDKNNNQNRKVELYFNNGDKYNINGVQDFTDNKVDQNTATVSLRAKFNNPDSRLIHGEFVNVKITRARTWYLNGELI